MAVTSPPRSTVLIYQSARTTRVASTPGSGVWAVRRRLVGAASAISVPPHPPLPNNQSCPPSLSNSMCFVTAQTSLRYYSPTSCSPYGLDTWVGGSGMVPSRPSRTFWPGGPLPLPPHYPNPCPPLPFLCSTATVRQDAPWLSVMTLRAGTMGLTSPSS